MQRLKNILWLITALTLVVWALSILKIPKSEVRAQDTGCTASLAKNWPDNSGATYAPLARGANIGSRHLVCTPTPTPAATYRIGYWTDGTTYSNTLSSVSTVHAAALATAAAAVGYLNASGSACTPGATPAVGCIKGVVTLGFSNAGDENCTENVFTGASTYPYGTKCTANGLTTFVTTLNAAQTGATPVVDPNLFILPCDFGGLTLDTFAELNYFNNGVPLSDANNVQALPWGTCIGAAANAGNPAVTGNASFASINPKQIGVAVAKIAQVYPWSGGPNPGANKIDNNVANHRTQLQQLGHAFPCTTSDLPSGFGSNSPAGRTGGSEVCFAVYNLGILARETKVAFPNIKILGLYPRMYGGISSAGPQSINAEPYAYEYAFAIQQVIRAQIIQEQGGGIDPVAGNLSSSVAPELTWDYNIWSGECSNSIGGFTNTRADGLCYTLQDPNLANASDFNVDTVHPGPGASQKINTGLAGGVGPFGQGRLAYWETNPYYSPWVLNPALGPTPTPTPTITPTPTATPTVGAVMFYMPIADFPATPTATPTVTPTPAIPYERVDYLGGLGQTVFNTATSMPNKTNYGQVNIACRIGWRFIQPSSGVTDWTVLDNCRAAAVAAGNGAKWTLSLRAGADTPLWKFKSSSCTASPSSIMPGFTSPGGPESPPSVSGTLNAVQFVWLPNYEYSLHSTQCAPIPWESSFLSEWQTFITLAGAHVAGLGAPFPDHAVAAGINSITQENSEPSCPTTSATCGVPAGTTDVANWTAALANDGFTSADFNPQMLTAYDTIIGYWHTAFPTTPLASMYVDSAGFPFNVYPSPNTYAPNTNLGIGLLAHLVSQGTSLGFTSIVMNNAANSSNTTPPVAILPGKILCFAGHPSTNNNCVGYPSSAIAFQEGPPAGVGCTTTPTQIATLLSTAQNNGSLFMETYQPDITCLP